MKEPLIKRAASNKSKGKTYSALLGKYTEAIESEYFGEAELVTERELHHRIQVGKNLHY